MTGPAPQGYQVAEPELRPRTVFASNQWATPRPKPVPSLHQPPPCQGEHPLGLSWMSVCPALLPHDRQPSSGSSCNSASSLGQQVKWAGLHGDKAFRIALGLTLDLVELQVVESVGENRKTNESWMGQEQAETCEHIPLSSKAPETREFRTPRSPWTLGAPWASEVTFHGIGRGQRMVSTATSA